MQLKINDDVITEVKRLKSFLLGTTLTRVATSSSENDNFSIALHAVARKIYHAYS